MNKLILGSAPLFLVSDLLLSVDYYCDVLGFSRPFLWGDPPGFAMPKRDDLIVMLQQAADKGVRNNGGMWDAYFWVQDARHLFESFRAKGAIVAYEPEERPSYGNLEFAIKDPDGYLLAFGQEYTTDTFFGSHPLEQESTTRFKHMNPVLSSADVARDIEWYEQKLGFKNVYDSTDYNEDPVNYAVLLRQGIYIHLQFQFPEDMAQMPGGSLRIEVENIYPLFEEYVEKGVVPKTKMVRNTPWGTNEFGFFDLNKNGITFYEDI